MITGKDFVFTGLQPWDLPIGSNARDIALEISKHNRGLYINTPLDKKTYWGKQESPDITQRRKVIKGELPTLRHVATNLWVLDYPFCIWSINFLPDGLFFDMANKMNQKKMYSFVQKTLRQLQFNEYTLFIDNDIYRSFYAKEYLSPKQTIYYRRDNLVNSFWSKHAPRLEPILCNKADIVLANSQQLANSVQEYNKHTYDIGQGVDLSNYDIDINYDIPEDIQNISGPIIGYTGMLTTLRLDIDLIYDLAKRLKTLSFVFVGKEDQVFQTHPIHHLENVHFLGMKDSTLMPNYISVFDICINPQVINPTTIGNYPRKIDEYLALGKNVVATRTDTMNIFKDYVRLCDNVDDYQKAIVEIIANLENDAQRQERILFARTHSWENSVNKLYEHVLSIRQI